MAFYRIAGVMPINIVDNIVKVFAKNKDLLYISIVPICARFVSNAFENCIRSSVEKMFAFFFCFDLIIYTTPRNRLFNRQKQNNNPIIEKKPTATTTKKEVC